MFTQLLCFCLLTKAVGRRQEAGDRRQETGDSPDEKIFATTDERGFFPYPLHPTPYTLHPTPYTLPSGKTF
jgi:hypothetical protein